MVFSDFLPVLPYVPTVGSEQDTNGELQTRGHIYVWQSTLCFSQASSCFSFGAWRRLKVLDVCSAFSLDFKSSSYQVLPLWIKQFLTPPLYYSSGGSHLPMCEAKCNRLSGQMSRVVGSMDLG